MTGAAAQRTPFRFASLASGSGGNCLIVEGGGSRLMADCGPGLRALAGGLTRLGIEPGSIDALLLTHEHEDHAGGAVAFALRHDIEVWSTRGTLAAMASAGRWDARVRWRELAAGTAVAIGAIEVLPFEVPHDAAEPVQYVFSDGSNRLGLLTDLGVPTPVVEAALAGCHALVLESNHDLAMLWAGPYPRFLKERIAGDRGHLDNAAAARLLGRLAHGGLQHVIAAHLSQKNNRPELAGRALAEALGCGERWIGIATQDAGFDWRELRAR